MHHLIETSASVFPWNPTQKLSGAIALVVIGLGCWGSERIQAEEPRVKDVSFVAAHDKTKQHYVVIYPRDFDPRVPRDVLIALHGHGSDRWQFVREARGECKAARDTAEQRKMLFVSPDYRARTSWMGPSAEADLVQIVSEIRKLYAVQRVFVCGGSMGGTAALTFAVRRPKSISGVVAMNGTANLLEFASFDKAIAESFGGVKSEIPEEYKARSAEYWPERLTMPTAMTAGGRDTVVPAASVLRLSGILQQLKRPVLLIHRDKGGHETNYEDAMTCLKFVIDKASAFGPKP